MKYFRKNGGITLIALVITLIVLLILAGVSIATLTGDNGILNQAQRAKEETEIATEEEQRKLAQLNATMNTQGYKYDTEDGQKVPIPAGFAPTQIDGENSIKDGVVVVDENGNEFVWIPCTKEEFNMQRNTETTENNEKNEVAWSAEQWYYNGGTWGDGQPNKPEIQKSIGDNGGFYIGRYEAGIPSNAPFYANSDGAEYAKSEEKDTSAYKPVSKKGVPAWNFITQKNAKDAAENMIDNNGVHSYLIDSHAWDTTCRVIRDKTEKSILDSKEWGNYKDNITTKYENLNTLYAWHEHDNVWGTIGPYRKGQVTGAPRGGENQCLELSTGASDDFKAYNIYDLAGNMWEWTTENGNNPGSPIQAEMKELQSSDVGDAKHAVLRGGSFGNDGDKLPVVFSNGDSAEPNGHSVDVGFRVVLYLSNPIG